jgi:DNA-binding MarR family transcriptional regulator
MTRSQSSRDAEAKAVKPPNLGPSLRRAWVGYQRRLDAALAAAGFSDRQFPDGRVLRMCRKNPTSISQIGRELGITRQGAHKIVASLRDRRYVRLRTSPTNRSEKIVETTARADEYLATHRKAVRAIERQLRAEIGDDAYLALTNLLRALGDDDEPRLRDYLRTKALREP